MNKLTITRFPQLSFAGGEAINSLCTNLSFAGENVQNLLQSRDALLCPLKPVLLKLFHG